MSSLIGQQIDRYRVLAHIDRGGMADVYLAEDVDLQRAVALKVMLDTLTADEQFVQRFRREAQMVARLDHPNIVQVYRTGVTDDNRPYIAMQYIDGGSLRDRLRHFAAENQLVPTAQALAIVRQVAVALGVAHAAGIIHRDLKPGNVLLKENGTPVLVDLGIAAVQGGARLTSTGNLIGTPHYMSPEQVRGLRLDGRSDLYSLGVILYELLSGERPFEASESVAVLHQHVYEPPPALMHRRPDLTPQTLHLVEKALAKAPERRYATAAEMVADVDAALLAESGGAPLRPTTVWLPEPQARDLLPRSEVISRQTPAAAMDAAPGEAAGPAGRRRGGLWAGLAVLLLAGAAVALVLWGGGGDTPASQPTGGLVQPTPALSGAALTAEPGDATSTVGPTLTPLPRPTDTVAPAEEPGETPAAAALAATRVGEDGKLLRLVPAGPFVRGSTAEEVDAAVALCRQNPDRETCAREDFASEMPPRTVTLRAFYMDETEVTNDEYRACVAADACEPPADGSGDYRRAAYFDEPAFGDYPVVYVSWEDAAAYCEWAGRRLPTEAEWEKGARGENGAIFPWGDAFDSSRANTQDRGVEEITAVGQYPTGASPYGLLDMAGNVWEYVADWFDPAYYAVAVDADPPGPDESPSGEKVLRSGSYANFQHYARAANRGAVTPDSRTAFRGFRCAVDAAP